MTLLFILPQLWSVYLSRTVLVINVVNTHDIKLARMIYQFLNPGDVLLGDCAFCSYADMFFIQNHDCDAVFRLSQTRKNEIERGKRKPLTSYESIEIWVRIQVVNGGMREGMERLAPD